MRFGQIEAGGEMVAMPMQHDGADARRQRVEETLDPEHHLHAEGVAFLGPRQGDQCDVAVILRAQRRRKVAMGPGTGAGHGELRPEHLAAIRPWINERQMLFSVSSS